MSTFSKTLTGCDGFIAGEHVLIDNLKFPAPGFLYSVGMAIVSVISGSSMTASRLSNALFEEGINVLPIVCTQPWRKKLRAYGFLCHQANIL